MDKRTSDSSKNEKAARTYEDICADIELKENRGTSNIERFVSLMQEMLTLKDLTADKVQFFFSSVNEVIEDAWSPFLVKASFHIIPGRIGNDRLVAVEIIKCCDDILESCGLSKDDIEQACMNFRTTKDIAFVTDYLMHAEMTVPSLDIESTAIKIHKITPQELACVTFICFNFTIREYAPSDTESLVKIDRAIAEHFSNNVLKEHAGKTLGGILSGKVFSTKKITELVYLYKGTTKTIRQQSEHIHELNAEIKALSARNAALKEEITNWKNAHSVIISKVEALETENLELLRERTAAENMLEYEKNKFHRQMQSKEAGIAEELTGEIALELEAIKETIEYVDEDNRRRIRRRLQRIDSILQEFGGESDA